MPDYEDRLEHVIQTDNKNNDTEYDVEEVEQRVRLYDKKYAESQKQNTRYGGGYINKTSVLPDYEDNELECSDNRDRHCNYPRENSRGFSRPYDKRHTQNKKKDTCYYHVVTYGFNSLRAHFTPPYFFLCFHDIIKHDHHERQYRAQCDS